VLLDTEHLSGVFYAPWRTLRHFPNNSLDCHYRLMKLPEKQLAIPLGNQKTVAKWLVIAIRPSWQTSPAKSLVMRGNDVAFVLMDYPDSIQL